MAGRRMPRWLLIGMVVTIALAIVAGVHVYTGEAHDTRRDAEHELTAVAQLKLDQLVAWRNERLADGAVLAESPQFAANLAAWLEDGDPAREERLRQRIEGLRSHYGYSAAFVLDAQGDVRLSLGAELRGLHADVAALLERSLADGQIRLTDLHRESEAAEPHLGLIVPLLLPNNGMVPHGAVILQLDPRDYLYPLIQTWPTPSDTAETMLVRREGTRVQLLSDLRFMDHAAVRYSEPLTAAQYPAVQAALGATGVVYGTDYRSTEVMAVALPVPDTDWHLITKVDVDEVMASSRSRSRLIVVITSVSVLALAAMALALWKGNAAAHYEALLAEETARHESEERYRTTLMSVGDGVIATDAAGCVLMMNPVAEHLTGWSQAEAAGRPLDQVFSIINEATRATVENPVARVLREGAVVGLANHTVLIAQDGAERPIADSAAPIRDAEGALTGVVLVFRDRTEERAAQRALQVSEQRYRMLNENAISAIATHQMVYDENGRPIDYVFETVNPAFERHTGLRAADVIGRRVTEVIPGIENTPFIARYAAVLKTGEPVTFEETSEPLGRTYRIGAYGVGAGRFATVFQDITDRVQAEQEARESRARLQAILDHSPSLIIELDPEGRYRLLNQAAAAVYGLSPEEVVGRSYRELLPPEAVAQFDQRIARVVAARQPLAVEDAITAADGEEHTYLSTLFPLFDQSGAVRSIGSIAHDITDRIRAEEALARERILLRTVLDHIPDAVYAKDLQGRKTLANAADLAYLGASSEDEVLGKTDAEVYDDDQGQRYTADDREVLEKGLPILNQEGWVRTPDGQERWFLGSKVPLHDQNGQVVGLVGITRDITERKRAEEALRESEALVRRKLRAIMEPDAEMGALTLSDIMDAEAIQPLLKDLYEMTGLPMALLDLEGNVLVQSGWQEICTRFHRQHPVSASRCLESDVDLTQGIGPGEFREYCCLNGLYDLATPIVVGGQHVGNLFLGQFLYDDEPVDRERFRQQAHQFGFDEQAYLAALERVPRVSHDEVRTASIFFLRLADMLSNLSFSTIRLSRAIAEQARLLTTTRQREAETRALLEAAEAVLACDRFEDAARRIFDVCREATGAVSGYVALMSDDGAENELLFLEAGGLPCSVSPELPMPIRGLREQAYRESRVVYENDFSGSAWTQFLPEGHVELRNVMFAPLNVEGRTVGIIGLANKDGDFGEDEARVAGALGDLAAIALERSRNTEALARERVLLRTVLDNLPDAVYAKDLQGRKTLANAADLKVMGVDREEEVLGKTDNEIFGPETAATFAQADREVLEGKTPLLQREILATLPGGRQRWLESTKVALHGANDDLAGLVGITRDITEHKRADEALRQSEEVFRRLFEEHSAVKLLIEPDTGRIVDANHAAAAFYGWSREQLQAMRIDEINLTPPEEMRAEMERARSEQRTHIDFRHRLADGTIRDVAVFSSPVATPDGMLLHSIVHDVTEQKRAEAALRESEELFRNLVQGAPDAIYVQTDGRYTYVNPATVALLGAASAEELLGQPVIERVDPLYQDAARLRIEQVNQARQPSTLQEEVWLKLDGSSIQIEVAAAPTIYEGQPGGITFARDISDRKSMESQLRQAQKMEAVGRLAGGVAHDFNNMLQVILGNADMALDQVPPDEPLHEYLQEIHRAGQRSADLTRQLLAFARKQTISPQMLDPNDTISGMLRMLRRLVGEDISLVWVPGADVGTIEMDPAQLDQILANLVVNARDAIQGVGQVTIETANVQLDANYAESHPDSQPGRYVMLSVSDDGIGMDQETLGRLFEPFFTTKPVGEGTGLGLATIYGIVRQNQGFVNVYSEPGQGTTFRIYLPRQEEMSDAPGEDAPIELPRGEGTVLLVEDEGSLRALAERILQRLGYTVLSAATPHEALQLSGHHGGEIILLITDVIMPQMNGRDLAQRLQAERPGLRCLYMSGYTANVVVHRGVVDAGTHFLQKPFTLQQLAAKVHETLAS